MKNKINSFQFAALGWLMGDALFVGFGIIIMLTLSKQDAWLTMLIATVLALIPILILIYIINYKPEKNFFEKTQSLFGKIFGKIINFISACYVLFMLTMVIWTTTFFVLTQYLSKVPFLFLAVLFLLTAIYAVIKGIETIARIGEMMLVAAIIIITTIIVSLYPHSEISNLKPLLIKGFKPLVEYACLALSYAFPPLFTLLAIPKDSLVDKKNCHKYLIIGFLISVFFIGVVFYFIITVNTIHIAELFRYPGYYVQYKIDVAGFFQGVENFLSLHWILNTFCMMMMCLFFLNRYVKDLFKLQEGKKLNIITLIIGLIIAYIAGHLFPSSEAGVQFMKEIYPYYIATSLFGLIIIIAIVIFFKKRKQKQKEVEKILLLN